MNRILVTCVEKTLMSNSARVCAVRPPMSRRSAEAAQAARAVRRVGRKVIL